MCVMKKFTLIELLVVVAIIGILSSLLLPSLGNARLKAKQAVCAAGQKQLGIALQMYFEDQNGTMTRSAMSGGVNIQWRVDIMPYLGLPHNNWIEKSDSAANKMFSCPVAELAWTNDYQNKGLGYNPKLNGVKILSIEEPTETALIGDTTDWTSSGAWNTMRLLSPSQSNQADPPVGDRHFKGINILWNDQHVSWKSQSALRAGRNGAINYFYTVTK